MPFQCVCTSYKRCRVLEKIDKRIEDNEILLSDLEVRQGFSIWCLSKETEGVFVQAGTVRKEEMNG